MAQQSIKPRLLLTGASGFLGFNICKQATQHYRVLGTVNNHPFTMPGIQQIKLDLTDKTALRNIVRESSPDAIIHTAAISDVNKCEQYPEEAMLLNVQVAISLAQLAAELAIPFVFTSTDMVFDGTQGYYTETDAVNPISKYGEQKVLAEEGIRKVYADAAICRMPLMYGVGGPGSKNFFVPMLTKIKAGDELGLFTDELRSSLGAQSAAQGLLVAALSSFKGTYHLGGPERISRYELGLQMASALGIDNPNIKAVRQQDIPMLAPRPKDASFNSAKAISQGFAPLSNQLEIMQAIAQL